MDSNSGIILPGEAHMTAQFTDLETIPCKGFNVLYRARRYGRWWVLKGLRNTHRYDEIYQSLLRKEFDLLIRLQHPGIVAAAGFEQVEGIGWCIVMEWVDGLTLDQWIHANRPAQSGSMADYTAQCVNILVQLLDIIDYVHAHQMVHRDLKPSNVMITANGARVKLIDFGLADADSYAILKQPAGTPQYMSPEQAVSRQADLRNDLYSIGCLIELMDLGKRYATVIRRSKAPIANRYAQAAEMKSALLAAGRKRPKGFYVALIMMIAALFTGVSVYFTRGDVSRYISVPAPLVQPGFRRRSKRCCAPHRRTAGSEIAAHC